MPRAYIFTKGWSNGPCARGTRARILASCDDPERIHEHEKPRAPEHKPETREDAAAPLHEFVSNVGNHAFGGAIARSQGAGIMPTGEVHPAVQSTIDSTRGSGQALDSGVSERLSPSPRGPERCPRTHRLDRQRPQPLRRRARVRDRHGRLLRAGPVQAEHVGRRPPDRPRARARRPAARRADERPADGLQPGRRDGERGGPGRRQHLRRCSPSAPPRSSGLKWRKSHLASSTAA